MLAGFEPCDDAERRCLAQLHRELGFSPVLEAIRLRDRDEGGLRSIKRVLRVLTGDDLEREARCWTDPPLATLRGRGGETGLSSFLEQLEATLAPLLEPGVRGPQSAR